MEAKLIGKFDIAAAGGGKGLLGDIDGDGRMEVVFVQADSGIDDRYVPHQITCVTAYRLTGELLWQRGDSSGRPGSFGSDFPAQIYDIDGDGCLEILCVMDKRFLILEGATGRVKEEHALFESMTGNNDANKPQRERQAGGHYPEGSVFPHVGAEQAV